MAMPAPFNVVAAYQYASNPLSCTFWTQREAFNGFTPSLAVTRGCQIWFEDYDSNYGFNYVLFHATVFGPGVAGLTGIYRTMGRITTADGGTGTAYGAKAWFRIAR